MPEPLHLRLHLLDEGREVHLGFGGAVAINHPIPTAVKLPAVTPLTLSLKVIVKPNVVALVGFVSARLIEVTVGAVWSTSV